VLFLSQRASSTSLPIEALDETVLIQFSNEALIRDILENQP
jgi:hypothetical protein